MYSFQNVRLDDVVLLISGAQCECFFFRLIDQAILTILGGGVKSLLGNSAQSSNELAIFHQSPIVRLYAVGEFVD